MLHRPMRPVVTERLLLRVPSARDVQAMLEIHQHPDVVRYLTPGVPGGDITVAWRNVAMMIGHWQMRGYGPWIVGERGSKETIGRVGFWFPDGLAEVEFGWAIRRSRWGYGFATEAGQAALQWARRNIRALSIISKIHTDNTASIRVSEKLGGHFQRTEEERDWKVHVFLYASVETKDTDSSDIAIEN